MSLRNLWFLPFVLLAVLAFGLAACNSAVAPEAIAPAGAADGRNTFIFLYTDN